MTRWWRVASASSVITAFLGMGWGLAIGTPARPPESAALFEDAAAATGLDFQHFIGATGSFFTPEIMGSGVALLDYDGDGDLDVFILQGNILDKSKSLSDALFPPPRAHWPGNRLFRNELIPTGKLSFVDVTEQAGLGGNAAYGPGVAGRGYVHNRRPSIFRHVSRPKHL